MAGFSVPNQVFAACDQISDQLLASPVSGLLGLAWDTIADSKATPFWQALARGESWDNPVMSFALTRFVDVQDAKADEPGGIFTMGYLNSSLYTGDIEYTPLVASSYWLIPLTGITVQGSTIFSGSANAAIDTGTTLIGGPSQEIASIFANIPDSTKGTGDFEGYYLFPCETPVNLTFSFGGGRAWTISPKDFSLQNVSPTTCVGAFFIVDSSDTGAPAWIIGDTFLKNVMSVYRFSPPAVGFAALSNTASTLATGPLPTPTVESDTISPSKGSASSLLFHNKQTGTQAGLMCLWTLILATTASFMSSGCLI